MSDLARDLELPVIIVVGLRLGCINHALLTAAAVRAEGLPAAGWVANCVDPSFDTGTESVQALQQRLQIPFVGILPHGESEDMVRAGDEMLDRLLNPTGQLPGQVSRTGVRERRQT